MHRKSIAFLLGLTMGLCSACGHGEILPPAVGEPIMQPEPEVVQPAEPEPEPIVKTATATIAATGDVLMHYPIIKTGQVSGGGEYNFDSIFPYFSSYVDHADYAVANLETTLNGLDNGYP